jgi:hypothetical protein
LSRERVTVLAKGKDCGGWIEAPEFFDQLYPVSAAEPQPNHNQMRFVAEKQFARQRRFIRFAAHHKSHAFRNQGEHTGSNKTYSMNNEHFCVCRAFP